MKIESTETSGPCMLVVVKRAVVVCASYQILLAFLVKRVVVKMFTFTELWLMAVVQFIYQLLFQKNKIGQILIGPHMGRLIYGTCR
jgi:hypothetical protein